MTFAPNSLADRCSALQEAFGLIKSTGDLVAIRQIVHRSYSIGVIVAKNPCASFQNLFEKLCCLCVFVLPVIQDRHVVQSGNRVPIIVSENAAICRYYLI